MLAASALRPLGQEQSISTQIAERVNHLIRTLRLRPGDQLPSERELAEALAVSRPSLREAFAVLQARGRVAVEHGRGVFVREPPPSLSASTLARIRLPELFAMRKVLEGPAADWAARAATARDLAELQTALARLDAEASIIPPDFERLRQLDIAFHMRIATAARNPFLGQTMAVLHQMMTMSMQSTLTLPGRLRRSRLEHRKILDALARGNPAMARRVMLVHIASAERAALSRIDLLQLGAPKPDVGRAPASLALKGA
ncbi:MAG: FadR family transcriptional regulator [Chloroflexota bacterium]|nr:FadR family transcriptional regulator [Chloroflexota bacterium]